MRKAIPSAILGLTIFATTLPAFPAKLKGASTLKDSQPAGTPDKDHKHQAYDLFFLAEGKSYTCRTNPKKSMNATEFVVGGKINYEIDKDKVKIKTPEDKEVACKVVRVEMIPALATPATP
jgi:hypothetical protein